MSKSTKPSATSTGGWREANHVIELYQRHKLPLSNRGDNHRWGTTTDSTTVLILSLLTKCFYVFHNPTKTFYRSVHPGSTKITVGTLRTVPEVDLTWLRPLIMSAIPGARELLTDPNTAESCALDTALEELEDDDDEKQAAETIKPVDPPVPPPSGAIKLPVEIVSTKEIRYSEVTKEVRLTQELLRSLLVPVDPSAITFNIGPSEVMGNIRWSFAHLVTVLRQLGEEIPEDAAVAPSFEGGRVVMRWTVRTQPDEAR